MVVISTTATINLDLLTMLHEKKPKKTASLIKLFLFPKTEYGSIQFSSFHDNGQKWYEAIKHEHGHAEKGRIIISPAQHTTLTAKIHAAIEALCSNPREYVLEASFSLMLNVYSFCES